MQRDIIQPKKILFIPVSSTSGIGEYMRSIIIAKALSDKWPDCEISFILNEKVPYLASCPYPVFTCKQSPTKDVKAVNEIIEKKAPDLVLFDASGRASQFKQAKSLGAKVAFISQHKKKRNRGLKLNRLFNTDIHWVAQPSFIMSKLSFFQRGKLAFFNKRAPKNIGPVFELPQKERQQQLLEKYNLVNDSFLLFNAGSGGHLLNGTLATDIYYQAAQEVQRITSIKCVVVLGSNYPKKLPVNSTLTVIKAVDNLDFISLLSLAKIGVVSAGDTLLQCIAIQKPCVAASVSPDQPNRLKRCEQAKLVLAAQTTVNSLVEHVQRLLDDTCFKSISAQINATASTNGLPTIIEDISNLFNSSQQ